MVVRILLVGLTNGLVDPPWEGEGGGVILDGFTLNPGDLEWSAVSALGEVAVYDRTPPELVGVRAAGAEVVLTNKTVLSAEVIEGLPELRYIGVLATGYNVVDVVAARRRGIVVTNVPGYGTAAVGNGPYRHGAALLIYAPATHRDCHFGDI